MNDDDKLDNEPGETEDKVGGDQGEPTEEPTDEVAALKATVEALQETVNAQQTQIYALQDANAQLMNEVENKGDNESEPESDPDDEEFTLTLDDLFE